MAHILIIATGGVRTPSALELLERFLQDGHDVRILAKKNALRFFAIHLISDFKMLGRFLCHYRPQLRETFAYFAYKWIGVPHVEEGHWCDVAVMMPATSNSVGKLVSGLADNYPLLVARAVPRTKRVLVVPSMNPEMWFDPFFQRNVDLLNATEKYRVLCPSRGQMASGDFGIGAQVPMNVIVAETYGALGLLDKVAESALKEGGTIKLPLQEGEHSKGHRQSIVIVDDDAALRSEIVRALMRANPHCDIIEFDQASAALEWLRDNDAAVILSELDCKTGATGHEFVEKLREADVSRRCQIVVTSGRSRSEVGAEKLAREDILFLPKPLNVTFAVGMLTGLLGGAPPSAPTTRMTLEMGETLFAQGDSSHEIYLVVSGELEVSTYNAGSKTILSKVSVGEIVGEMAFLTHAKRSATVMATERTRVVKIEVEQFFDYLDRQPAWLRQMIHTIARRLREADLRYDRIKRAQPEDLEAS